MAGKAQFIQNPNSIKSRVKVVHGKDANDLISMADQSVKKLAGEFGNILKENVRELTEQRPLLGKNDKREDAIEAIRRVLHDLRGQAGTFGYPLVSSVADNTVRFIDKMREPGAVEGNIIGMHLDALTVIATNDMKGDGGAAGKQLIDGLRQVVRKYAPGII